MNSNYVAPFWLPSGHLQTIIPAKVFAKPTVAFNRTRWTTPDNDFIDLDFLAANQTLANNAPLLVLFHGLEGSSDSHYARALMQAVEQQKWAGVVVHFRGCSGEINSAPRFYHSGDAIEIDWILRRLHQQHPARQILVCGVSLGGNALLRWLGEQQASAAFVSAACAISAPLDLSAGGDVLGRGFNKIYTHVFLRTLKPKCEQKLAQFPHLFDRNRMMSAKNLYEFDNVITAPLHGYKNTEDYWHRASAKHILNDICVPTLVLNAQNDPFLPAQFLPKTASKYVTLDYPKHGGHVGFAGQGKVQNGWLPKRILGYLQGQIA